ncbi:MAG: hypothetical protein KDA28_04090, partial [Phycisphaerales bacterium]|nr:hypothetical protein [Phycisphaerales bacterium]
MERKKAVHIAEGQSALAARELVRMARTVRIQDETRARAFIDEALRLSPGDEDASSVLAELMGIKPPSAVEEVAEDLVDLTSGDFEAVEVEEVEEDGPPLFAPPEDDEPRGPRLKLDEFDALFDLGGGMDDDEEHGFQALDDDPLLITSLRETLPPEPEPEPEAASSLEIEIAVQEPEPPPVGFDFDEDEEIPEELEEAIEEAEFFAAQGLIEDARGALFEILGEFPAHADLIMRKMDALFEQGAEIPLDPEATLSADDEDVRLEQLEEKLRQSGQLNAVPSLRSGAAESAMFVDDGDAVTGPIRTLPAATDDHDEYVLDVDDHDDYVLEVDDHHDDLFVDDDHEDDGPGDAVAFNDDDHHEIPFDDGDDHQIAFDDEDDHHEIAFDDDDDHGIAFDEEDEAPEPPKGNGVPAAPIKVDAPLGRASSAVRQLFSFSKKVLDDDPSGELADAIHMRLDGNGMMAM